MKILLIVIIVILLSFILPISNSFGQNDQRELLDEYCKNYWRESPDMCTDYIPKGYFDRTSSQSFQEQLTESDKQKLEELRKNPELKCPSGTYYGLDNQRNPACRDVNTNQIVDPTTGLKFDSQTGNIIFNDNQTLYIGIGIFIVIIIIVGIAAASHSKPESEVYSSSKRRGWTEIEKETVRIRQNGKCNMCTRPPPRWEYHHKDGDRSNNDLSNCEGLCPNCHAVKTHG